MPPSLYQTPATPPPGRDILFASMLAHDLKAPLRGIEHLSQWLREDLAKESRPAVTENLELLQESVSRLKLFVDDLQDYALAGSGKDGKQKLRLKELLPGEGLNALTGVPRSFFILEPEREVELSIGPLRRIASIYLDNAVKHHGGSEGKVEISLRVEDDFLILEVADDGPGIEERFHARIFEPGQTLQPKDRSHGSGMGLAIASRIAECHGAQLGLVSAQGHGSRFSVRWPLGS